MPVVTTPRKPRLFADRLDVFPVLTATPRSRFDRPYPIRGAKEIIARLAGKGVELRLSPDRTTIVPSGNRAYFDAARAAAPLHWPLLAEG